MRNAKLEDGGILRLYLLKGEDFTTLASYKISKNCFYGYPQTNSTISCAVKILRNIDNGYTVE